MRLQYNIEGVFHQEISTYLNKKVIRNKLGLKGQISVWVRDITTKDMETNVDLPFSDEYKMRWPGSTFAKGDAWIFGNKKEESKGA